MKLNKGLVDLICDIEYEIGYSCYNPNSQNGWTGEIGKWFRYPVYYSDKSGECKTKCVVASLNKNNIDSLEYKFGSNHLQIGTAIINVLELLEERYSINFNELEKIRKDDKDDF